MFQILKRALTSPLQFALSLGFVLGIWLAWRVARRNRQRGAQCFGRLAASVERGWSGLAPAARQENRSRWMIQSLLLQRAPWEEVRPWTQELSRPASGMELAFSSYFADENFEQAHLAATNWCRAVESEVEDQKAMQAFFARYGDKSSKQRLNEIFADMDAPKSGDAPDETLSKVGTIPPAHERVFAYYRYYDAHLSLEAARWMQGRNPRSKRYAGELERQRTSGDYLGLPWFRVNASSLRALGMNPRQLEAARRRAMGG